MARFDITGAGRPHSDKRHRSARAGASLIAAVAGGLAFVLAMLLIVSTTSPSEAPPAWIAVAVLTAVWLTGIWWRWDAPGVRDPHHERERRSF